MDLLAQMQRDERAKSLREIIFDTAYELASYRTRDEIVEIAESDVLAAWRDYDDDQDEVYHWTQR